MNNIETSEAGVYPGSNIMSLLKFTSILHFLQSIIFFLSSFLIFIVKRTEGFDPWFLSGAYQGTIQLFVFTVLNIGTLISFFAGYYLYKYTDLYDQADNMEMITKRYIITLMIYLGYLIVISMALAVRFIYF